MTTWIAGVDGCRAGWIAVLWNIESGEWRFRFSPALAGIVDAAEQPHVVAVDMPTGFADRAERGGRPCERAARKLLPGKTSSVFATPCRAALAADTYAEASALNHASGPHGVRLTKQCYNLFPKMRELDALLQARPALRRRIFEAHPELAFMRMNGGRPVLVPKRKPEGQAVRQRLLARHGFASTGRVWATYRHDAGLRRSDAGPDDGLDAAAVCRTALLIHRTEAAHLPDSIARDCHGLPMAIWY